ncbi:hypothetical protein DASC09_062240 [Saccharomycopsis crataegensis]|uniref:Uncharacterized protein n=1 Tax=Saccharomycopsis crataegensis TaxID=43959 RepID=A0AAV5QXP0_9ASCO|nr:hypothetical protein DASC09_062240 [Saccharomycopsis crataegensis]
MVSSIDPWIMDQIQLLIVYLRPLLKSIPQTYQTWIFYHQSHPKLGRKCYQRCFLHSWDKDPEFVSECMSRIMLHMGDWGPWVAIMAVSNKWGIIYELIRKTCRTFNSQDNSKIRQTAKDKINHEIDVKDLTLETTSYLLMIFGTHKWVYLGPLIQNFVVLLLNFYLESLAENQKVKGKSRRRNRSRSKSRWFSKWRRSDEKKSSTTTSRKGNKSVTADFRLLLTLICVGLMTCVGIMWAISIFSTKKTSKTRWKREKKTRNWGLSDLAAVIYGISKSRDLWKVICGRSNMAGLIGLGWSELASAMLKIGIGMGDTLDWSKAAVGIANIIYGQVN